MSMIIRPLAFAPLLFSLFFASCNNPAYRPLDPSTINPLFRNPNGYAEVPVRPGYYEVGYSSVASTNPTESRFYATVRAAEIALENHKPYFEIIQARPGETPLTWAVADHPTAPTPSDLAAIQAANNTINLDAPSSSLLIHLLDAPPPATLSALDILHLAQQKGITFSPTTNALVNSSPTTLPETHK